MGKTVERRRKKKKKDRPSLVDLQKRSLKEQQHQQKKQTPNIDPLLTLVSEIRTISMTPTPFLRSTRRFPNPDEVSPEVENNETSGHQDYELRGKRREKELKISSDCLFRSHLSSLSVSISIRILTILNLTPRTMSLQQTSRSEKSMRSVKRKRSMFRLQSLQRPSKGLHWTWDPRHLYPIESYSCSSLTGFQMILQHSFLRLRDYHEVIEHPMDFGSVRKKLARGAYAKLKQFEDNLSLALATVNLILVVWLSINLRGTMNLQVRLLSEYGHSRILARLLASKKIEQSLPAGINFGPGWVGEDVVSPRPLAIPNPAPAQVSPSQLFSRPGNSCKVSSMEMAGDKSLEDTEREDTHAYNSFQIQTAIQASLSFHLRSCPQTPFLRINLLKPSAKTPEPSSGEIRPGPSFQNPVILHRMKGVYGFNFPAQIGKLIGSTRPSGINFQTSWNDNMISRVNNSALHPTTANGLTAEDS